MDEPIIVALVVSGIGMLMLFLALAFLYGLMVLMTRITSIRALSKDQPEAEEAGGRRQGAGGRRQEARDKRQEARSRKQRAAVIAVALARAEQEIVPPSVPPTGGEERGGGAVSPWRTLHHQRQLTLHLRTRRGR